MALLNGYYIHVTSEEVTMDNELSSHSVEEGMDITDAVKQKPTVLSISGKIVDYNPSGLTISASNVLETIRYWRRTKKFVTYEGRNISASMQIVSFTTSHPNTVAGGAEFSMELREVRLASNAYIEKKDDENKSTVTDGGTKQVDKGDGSEVYYTVKKGDCVWNLVAAKNAPYASLSRPAIDGKEYSACDWVMQKNQGAFSRKGDFRTLQIGEKLLMGYKK